jgi:hypothetical protein
MPDLDLIKQGKQVKTFVLEEPPRRFARIPSLGITGEVDRRISNLLIHA